MSADDVEGEATAFARRFGAHLRERRDIAGLTQGQLGRRLPGSVDGGQISRWERGASWPTYANLIALARAFGVTEEELIRGPWYGGEGD